MSELDFWLSYHCRIQGGHTFPNFGDQNGFAIALISSNLSWEYSVFRRALKHEFQSRNAFFQLDATESGASFEAAQAHINIFLKGFFRDTFCPEKASIKGAVFGRWRRLINDLNIIIANQRLFRARQSMRGASRLGFLGNKLGHGLRSEACVSWLC